MNRARTPLAAIAGVLALAGSTVTGCADGNTDATPTTTDPALAEADVVVVVEDNEFDPEEIDVSVGDTVGWSWQGDNNHDVAFDDGPASHLQRNGTWTRTFDDPGTYAFVCTLHSSMTGTVTVTA